MKESLRGLGPRQIRFAGTGTRSGRDFLVAWMGACLFFTSLAGCALFNKPDDDVAPVAVPKSETVPEVEATPPLTGAGPEESAEEQFGLEGQESEGAASPETVLDEPMPEDATAAFRMAADRMESGPEKYASAIRLFDRALEFDSSLTQAHFNKGIIFFEQRKFDKAVKSYRKALELDPSFAEAWANLADLHRFRGDYAGARDILLEGLKELPDNSLLLNNHALMLRLMGRSDEAISEVRKILKINAVDVNAFNNLGRIYLGKKDYEMARLVFQKALITVPEAKDDPFIHHNLGIAYLGLDDPRAQDEFERAISLKGDLTAALVGRAYLHLTIQEYDKAAALLTRAVGASPKSVSARLDLGVALRGMNEFDRAEVQYQEALKIEPKNPIVLRNYGILLGDYKKDFVKAAEIYSELRSVLEPGPERDAVEDLIKDAERDERRRQKRIERDRKRAEERERRRLEKEKAAAEAAAKEAAAAEGSAEGGEEVGGEATDTGTENTSEPVGGEVPPVGDTVSPGEGDGSEGEVAPEDGGASPTGEASPAEDGGSPEEGGTPDGSESPGSDAVAPVDQETTSEGAPEAVDADTQEKGSRRVQEEGEPVGATEAEGAE